MIYWVITRKDNGFPILVYPNKERTKIIAEENHCNLVEVTTEGNREKIWWILEDKKIPLIYWNQEQAKMYAEILNRKIIGVSKI